MRTASFLILLALLLVGGLWFVLARGCTDVGTIEAARGSHGYRLFDSPELKSFLSDGGRVCVPHGWLPLGTEDAGEGWARFPAGETGVIVRSDAFASSTLAFAGSAYQVTLLIQKDETATRATAYEAVVRNAFEHVGALYAEASGTPRMHTVLVTAGLTGIDDERDSVYPDPNALVSYIILPPTHTRSEELFVHAITHLYNRFRPDLDSYEEAQAPFTKDDWQEMEAAWAELAFESSNQNRDARCDYLLNVHHAVVTRDFSLITAPPFNDHEAFAAMRGTLPVPEDSTYDDLDDQYGHYVLAPLILAAVDGMLEKHGDSVASLLKRVHDRTLVSFYGALRAELPESDIAALKSWMNGAAIPDALVRAGVARYDAAH